MRAARSCCQIVPKRAESSPFLLSAHQSQDDQSNSYTRHVSNSTGTYSAGTFSDRRRRPGNLTTIIGEITKSFDRMPCV
jgi:hypothetical protein